MTAITIRSKRPDAIVGVFIAPHGVRTEVEVTQKDLDARPTVPTGLGLPRDVVWDGVCRGVEQFDTPSGFLDADGDYYETATEGRLVLGKAGPVVFKIADKGLYIERGNISLVSELFTAGRASDLDETQDEIQREWRR